MNSYRILALTLSFVLSPLPTQTASAISGEHSRVQCRKKKKKINAKEGHIVSVTGESVTVMIAKTQRTYKIDKNTNISINDKKGTAQDLKKGMHVEIDGSSIDPGLALSIDATDALGK